MLLYINVYIFYWHLVIVFHQKIEFLPFSFFFDKVSTTEF